jgi:hypothetical protein
MQILTFCGQVPFHRSMESILSLPFVCSAIKKERGMGSPIKSEGFIFTSPGIQWILTDRCRRSLPLIGDYLEESKGGYSFEFDRKSTCYGLSTYSRSIRFELYCHLGWFDLAILTSVPGRYESIIRADDDQKWSNRLGGCSLVISGLQLLHFRTISYE